MDLLFRRLQTESSHFASLPKKARVLVLSYFLRGAAYPIISVFIGAYIWRGGHDIAKLIVYNIAAFGALPPIFLVNKWLLKWISLKKLYAVGLVISGLSAFAVVFYHSTALVAYALYGLFYGVGNGIHWANRNVLTLRHTDTTVRSYFTGLNFSLSTIAAIIVPILSGWFIVLTSTTFHLFASKDTGYMILTILAVLALLAAGLIIQQVPFEDPDVRDASRIKFSPMWQRARLLSLTIGIVDAPLYILPTVLVLLSLGNEGVLGTVNSLIAVLIAGATYVFGRTYHKSQFYPVFTAFLFVFAIAGIPLLWSTGVGTIIWYLLCSSVADNLIWIANEPMLMDMQDEEARRGIPHYRLIIDREWFIDGGRIIMLVIFLALLLIGQDAALRFAGVISGLLALAMMLPVLRR